MKGVALLVALSACGVDYSWRTTDEGQLEYVIQIEPEFIKSLADGEEIHSDVPTEAGVVQRLCVRIGTTPAKHSTSSVQEYKRLLVSAGRYASANPAVPPPDAVSTIVWPSKALPEQSYNVTYGWQPDQTGQQAYYMQIDPTLLGTLAVGDEIHASLDPSAGGVGRFVVLSGNKQLPRVSGKPAASSPPQLAAVDTSRNRFQPAANSPPAFQPPPKTAPPVGPPSFATTPTVSDDALYPQRPRYNEPAADLRPPMLPPPPSSFNPPTPTLDPTAPAGYSLPQAPPTYNDPRYQQPLQPPADLYASQPQPRTSYAPPTYNTPAPPTYTPPAPVYSPPPPSYSTPPVENRVASVTREAPAAPPLPAPQISNASTSRSSTTSDADKPWWPLMFTAFALFLSIGGNLYLGWTAAEFHSRYRLAIERLRSAGRT
jgi:hypothetical protein